MEVTKWLKPSDSVSQIGEPRLPLWVKPGSQRRRQEGLLLGVTRTKLGPKQTLPHKGRPSGETRGGISPPRAPRS